MRVRSNNSADREAAAVPRMSRSVIATFVASLEVNDQLAIERIAAPAPHEAPWISMQGAVVSVDEANAQGAPKVVTVHYVYHDVMWARMSYLLRHWRTPLLRLELFKKLLHACLRSESYCANVNAHLSARAAT